MLSPGIHDPALCQPGELARARTKYVGLKPLEPDLAGDRFDERGEAAGDKDSRRSPSSHCPDQSRCACIGANPLDQTLVDGCDRQPVE